MLKKVGFLPSNNKTITMKRNINPKLTTHNPQLFITESFRDAVQGLKIIIPTEEKAHYLNLLLKVGFNYLDAGSFVSAKTVPQMADTPQVLKKLDLKNTVSKIMILVVNQKGAEQAVTYEQIAVLSFPFSVSETFLNLNLKLNMQKAFERACFINDLCKKHNKEFFFYLSMGLGNPYGDKWHPDIVMTWMEKCRKEGISRFGISDITGEADAERITFLFSELYKEFPALDISLHLHTDQKSWYDKVKAAWETGVRHFDTVLGGIGGCPMTGYELLGNLNTLDVLRFCKDYKLNHHLNEEALRSMTDYSFL